MLCLIISSRDVRVIIMTQELNEKIKKLPVTPGTYIFKDAAERIIYVGKAKNIKKRVFNHFSKPDQHTVDFTPLVADVDFIAANNENEALLLESQLIKKYQPRYNFIWKDDKDYFFIAFTEEKFPRPHLTHRPGVADRPRVRAKLSRSHPCESLALTRGCIPFVGPFMQGGQLRNYLRELRKLFPFRTCNNMGKTVCMYEGMGLCPAPCQHSRQTKQYKKSLQTLRQMLWLFQGAGKRIEGYDISNLSGTLSVGSMVVFKNGKADKNEYRKFKINTVVGQNDVASLREVLTRRLNHDEWPKPDLILLDGGKGQLKAARGIDIPVIALAKTGNGRLFSQFSKTYIRLDKLPKNIADLFLQIRDEAHRFAITYNKLRREKVIKNSDIQKS